MAFAAAVIAAAVPLAANAAPDTLVRLEYQADDRAGCVGEDDLRLMISDQAGQDHFRADADRRVIIHITKVDGRYQGRIVWKEADGRTFGERLLVSRGPDCRQIAANVAFTVALQLQLIRLGQSGDPARPPAPPVPSPPPPPKVVELPPPPSPPPEKQGRPVVSMVAPQGSTDRVVLSVGVGPAVDLGMAPGATAAGRLFVAGRLRRWSAEIAVDAALPATLREVDGSGVVIRALGSSAAACAHMSFLATCVLGRLGWIRGRGIGVDAPATAWTHFNEVGARLSGGRSFGRLSLGARVDGLVMLSPWNVVLNETVVWRIPRLGAVFGIDLAVRFF